LKRTQGVVDAVLGAHDPEIGKQESFTPAEVVVRWLLDETPQVRCTADDGYSVGIHPSPFDSHLSIALVRRDYRVSCSKREALNEPSEAVQKGPGTWEPRLKQFWYEVVVIEYKSTAKGAQQ
jgi:hypothetical protein